MQPSASALRRLRALAAALAALVLLAAPAARAAGEQAGAFDYFVLALSWSPSFCVLEGDARGEDQCDPRHDHGFTLHGLWPQYERGWPSDCRSAGRDPSRAETAAMADIMGSAGLAWHQWTKHGRCSGLDPRAYFALSRRAFAAIRLPEVLRRLSRDVRLPARVVEEALVEANPGLTAPAVAITCEAGMIREARICLTPDLAFRPCGADAARDCRTPDALLPAIR